MKIVIASNAFKNSLTANDACRAVREGVMKNYPDYEYDICPISDGGDSICEVLGGALGARAVSFDTVDALSKPTATEYFFAEDGKIAIIESARVIGLAMLDESELNPMRATSFGLGECMKDALDRGCRTMIVGIGGTATNDCGMGMLSAFGVKFFDACGNLLDDCGESLQKIARIDLSCMDKRILDIDLLVANDVTNPLYGKSGAAYVYAGQKGADAEMIENLDRGLQNVARVTKEMLRIEPQKIVGGGSGGGLGFALRVFLNAKIERGFSLVESYIKLEEKIKEADVVITGEGYLDGQTGNGKGPMEVAVLAKKYNKKVIAVCGNVQRDISFSEIDQVYAIAEYKNERTLEDMMANAHSYLVEISEKIRV